MRVVTGAEMRALDHRTIHELGVPGVVLMESAGRGVVDAIAAMFPRLSGLRAAVVAGPGNNGGDGYVVARHLHGRGVDVALLVVADEAKIAGDARVHFEAARRSGVTPRALRTASDLTASAHFLDEAEVIVDALLGTGTARAVEGHMAAVIARMNAAPGVRVAVDVPSGIDVDTGSPLGACVAAHFTVTFAFAKVGLVTSPGFLHAGALRVVDIGIPERLADELPGPGRIDLLDETCLDPLRAARAPTSHKGTFGHVVVIAGSKPHPGAALLSAEAALRGGAGLVTVATSDDAMALLAGRVPEVSFLGLGREPVGAAPAWRVLGEFLDGKRAVAFGPGVARTTGMRGLLERLLARWEHGLVVDADGLNLLAEDPSVLDSARARVVLTPHPTEMARLTRLTTAAVQADRVGVARAFAARHGAVVVLKGARTVIAAPDQRVAINPTGNPGMATGGTGDALTGLVAALLANGMSPFDAACAGAYLHGKAGDLARDEIGDAGLMTSDLIARIPRARANP